MTLIAVSMFIIALVNIALMATVVVMLLRVKRLLTNAEQVVRTHGVPLLEKFNKVAEDVKQMSGDVRRVEERVSGAAGRVIDQVEPPIRHFAAVLAGVRAGVGRLFEGHQDGGGHAALETAMRKEL